MGALADSNSGAESWRYAAFISYSHRDRRAAAWLHRAIETFKVPTVLVRRSKFLGANPERLAPVFLDREELSSGASLSDSIVAALRQSEYLIVVCSPAAAASPWVNEEIRNFKMLGRAANILCLIVSGNPGAASHNLPAESECFPRALRYEVIDGQVSEVPAPEPLAADLRKGSDARRDAKLKLLAGLLGVNLDELRQREQARRQRRLALVSVAATLGCIVLAGLAVAAWLSRNEAERQRAVAVQKSLTADRTAQFMVSLFEVVDPSESRGNSITAREILDRGAKQIATSLHDEPQVKAELSTTLGRVYRGIGLYEEANQLLSTARAIPGQPLLNWVRETNTLGELELQRGDYERAGALYLEAERAFEQGGGSDLRTREQILLGRAAAAAVLQQPVAARGFLQSAMKMAEPQVYPDIHVEALEGLAMTEYYANDMNAAERYYQQALAARIAYSGATHPKVSELLNGLALTALSRGDRTLAESYLLRVYAADRQILGDHHPDLAPTLMSLGRVRLERREFARATESLNSGIAIMASQQSDMHEDLVFGYSNLGLALMGRGDYGSAAPALERALAIAVQHKHPLQGPIRIYQADLQCRMQHPRQALPLLDAARAQTAANYPDDAWRPALADSVRADCLGKLQRWREAEALIASSTPLILKKWPAATMFGHDALERALRVYTHSGDSAKVATYQAMLTEK